MGLFNEKQAVPAQASGRIHHWALTLAMYDYHLVSKSGLDHANADALSRLSLPESIPITPQPAETDLLMEQVQKCPITADHIKTWTRHDPVLTHVVRFVQHGWPSGSPDKQLQPFWQKRLELSCQDGCLLWGNCIVLPALVCWRSYMKPTPVLFA